MHRVPDQSYLARGRMEGSEEEEQPVHVAYEALSRRQHGRGSNDEHMTWG